MVRTTTGKGAEQIEWRRPRGARAVADTRWFTDGDAATRPDDERPSFFQLLVPLVALSLGSILAVAVVVAVLLGIVSLVM